MAKKRKAGGRSFGDDDEARRAPIESSKLRINTFEDVADSEDEFHINRDKVMLEEGPAQKKQRQLREEEAFLEPSDEEVLAASEDVSESEDEFEDTQEKPKSSHRPSKALKSRTKFQDSDSEASATPVEDENIGGWGSSRKDYYDADIIETEADALEEEAEARRLQQKQLQGMTEADFGFDEADWLEHSKDFMDQDDEGRGRIIQEVLPKLDITDAMGPEERMKILRARYPEFEPLAKEFLDLQTVNEDLKTTAIEAIAVRKYKNRKVNEVSEEGEAPTPLEAVKYSILAAYLAALSMYFALLTSGQEALDGRLTTMSSEELRDHPIMETLAQCRDLWQKAKDLVSPASYEIENNESSIRNGIDDKQSDIKTSATRNEKNQEKSKKRKHRRSKTDKAAQAAQLEAEKLRAEKLRKTEQELADLSTLMAPSKLSRPSKKADTLTKFNEDNGSDFGEQTTLTPHEAAEKAQRKKSLRFYTSQIAQKSNKRDAAGRDAGGDADIPYRERLKDRQERLNAEAEKRGKQPKDRTKGDSAPGGPSDDEDDAAAQELRNGAGSGSEDYYDLVASRVSKKKAAKAALTGAHAKATREGGIVRILDDQTVGEDGKRAISYQIEKNKGITPKRGKDVRNPRVKKRKKFEEKKKKLGSMKPVWKGGEGRGGYGGELTGIKAGLVKSIKL